MQALAKAFSDPKLYEGAQKLRRAGPVALCPKGVQIGRLPGPLAGWTAMRDLKPVAKTELPRVVAKNRRAADGKREGGDPPAHPRAQPATSPTTSAPRTSPWSAATVEKTRPRERRS